MFRNFITSSDIFAQYPKMKEWVSDSNILSIINMSAKSVVIDLRKRNIDLTKIYVPLKFHSSEVTETDYTSESISPDNEKRLIIDVKAVTTNMVFTLYGSDNNTTFYPLLNIDGTPLEISINTIKTYSAITLDTWRYIKYAMTGSGTYDIYFVDISFDDLIIYKTIQNIVIPVLGSSDGANAIYQEVSSLYDKTITNIKYDYDKDSSGDVGELETNHSGNVIFLKR
jgi:hypothetical protein